jgi:ABC-type nitrate/sulfonate/bicarbonate transport system substrate-binding protein
LYSWPLYVAQAKRLFEGEGISVEVTLTGSSERQLEALIRGGFDIGFQQSDHVVRAVESGSDLFIFMAQAHAPELTLVAAPDVSAFAALRGRDIAVDGARTGYALLLRRLLAAQGLGDGDYTFREIGGSRERFEALKSGAACASLLNAPFDRNLIAAGFHSLGTVGEYFPAYPGSIAAARRSWAQRNRGSSSLSFVRSTRVTNGCAIRHTKAKRSACCRRG